MVLLLLTIYSLTVVSCFRCYGIQLLLQRGSLFPRVDVLQRHLLRVRQETCTPSAVEQNKYQCNNKYYYQQLHYKTDSVINNDQYEGEESVEADLHRLQN